MENNFGNISLEMALNEARDTNLVGFSVMNSEVGFVSESENKIQEIREDLEAKRKEFVRITDDKIFFLEVSKRVKLVIAYLGDISDKESRENCVYNAIMYYLNGNKLEAGNYVKMLESDPKGLLEWLFNSKNVRKSALELKKLFRFMEQNKCAARYNNIRENEVFYRALTMLLNVKGSHRELLEYLDNSLKELSKVISKSYAILKSAELAMDTYKEQDNVNSKTWDGVLGGLLGESDLMAANA